MWVDRGTFWEHRASQGSEEWKKARMGRINSSNTGAMAGKSSFKNPEETGRFIAGVEVEEFSTKSLEAMNHGHQFEPICREWYEKTYKCKVLERGLCIPKNCDFIGASVDGEIIGTEGIIEIKCPKKMYRPILNYMNMKEQGWTPPINYYNHIWSTHLCQMMQAMFVLNKQYCDYIVYSTEDSKVFVQRVHFDPIFWNNHFEIIQTNYSSYIIPYLTNSPLRP